MNKFFSPLDYQATSDGSVNTLSLVGSHDFIRLSTADAGIKYIIAPDNSTALQGTISSAKTITANKSYAYTLSANHSFKEGQVVEVRESDGSTVVGMATVRGTSDFRITDNRVTLFFHDISGTIGNANKIYWGLPSAARGAYCGVGDDDHIIKLPHWAKEAGEIRFVREASTDAKVSLDDVILS